MKPHVAEGITVVFVGPQRIGKTLSMVVWALDAFQHGRKIFSNIQLGFGHEPLEFTELALADGRSRFLNGFACIDELNFYYDARRSISGPNIEFGAFLLQQKKQGCTIAGTTHNLDYLDLRLRQNYDYAVYPNVYPAYPAPPVVLEMRIENGPLQRHYRRKMVIDCRPFLGLYDTHAVYDPFKERKARKMEDETPKRKRRVTL